MLENEIIFSLLFLLSLMAVFFIHEGGHLLMARLFNVHVASVSLGFGREAWGRTDKHGTRWSIRVFPFCGMVQLTDPDRDKPDDFAQRPVWQRFCMVAAGPAANILFALILFTGFYALIGQPASPPIATAIEVDGPADRSGMMVGDRIYTFEGATINRYEDITAMLGQPFTQPVQINVIRGDTVAGLMIEPEWIEYTDIRGFERSHSRLGILALQRPLLLSSLTHVDGENVLNRPDLARTLLAARLDQDMTLGILSTDRQNRTYRVRLDSDMNQAMITPHAEPADRIYLGEFDGNIYIVRSFEQAVLDGLASSWRLITGTIYTALNLWPIDYSRITPDVIATGGDLAIFTNIHLLLFVTAFLSICIALINLLPLPGLDGHLMYYYVFEKLRGRERAEIIYPYFWRIMLLMTVLGVLLFNVQKLGEIIRVPEDRILIQSNQPD